MTIHWKALEEHLLMVPRVPTVWKSFGILKKNSRALNRFGIL
jgi:hypothetical protein